jgi:hypothetical protein
MAINSAHIRPPTLLQAEWRKQLGSSAQKSDPRIIRHAPGKPGEKMLLIKGRVAATPTNQ